MSEIEKHKQTMRCPVCFSREIDVLMVKRGNGFYCVKCSYEGSPEEIKALYKDIKKKYKWMLKRVPLEAQEKI